MTIKNIAFRVDASRQIGTGHFMRCLTIADAIVKHGGDVRFVCRYLESHLESMLKEKGYQLARLGGEGVTKASINDLAHSHWLGVPQNRDSQECIDQLSDVFWDWIVVDHYGLDKRWESAIRSVTRKILVIDDLADRPHDCDVLLDQNFYLDLDDRYHGKVPKHCKLLLGPRYALLREEFRSARQRADVRTGLVKRLFVFFGGVDADNHTGRVLQALARPTPDDLIVDVVIGANHPNRVEIDAICAEQRFNCHVQTTRMAEIMMEADMAIGAGGATIWERCCLGLPTFSVPTAQNQVKQVTDAASRGLLYGPRLEGTLQDEVPRHLSMLTANEYLRKVISANAMKAVDGLGVSRTLRVLGLRAVEVKMASQGDSTIIFSWRNHESIRKVSRDMKPIAWEDHQKWFSAVLASSNRVLLLGYRDGNPVGVVRFDINDESAEVSIYVSPELNEPGIGGPLLLSAEQWLIDNRADVRQVTANVLGSNLKSHRLFIGTDYDVASVCYSKRLH